MISANNILEVPTRIEPARLENAPEETMDLVAELSAISAALGARLHQQTARNLGDLVRIMNCYYSNLIEGHHTRPRDIQRALDGDLDEDEARRNLQIEAAAHIRVQKEIERQYFGDTLPEPAGPEFIKWLHREFYHGASDEMLTISNDKSEFVMVPGEWRSAPEHDVVVGQHIPPSSHRVGDFMDYFARRYEFARMGKGAQILAVASAHHRLNYIHPFADGNGRVSRLMSHAMALKAGIGSHGLWSVSRGLARGLESRTEYMSRMDAADRPRQGDLDGRGNLSQQALVDFTNWFLRICIDQVTFMSDLFDLNTLDRRLARYVERSDKLKPEAANLLSEALIRGEFERGEASRITGLPERTARRVLNDLVSEGLLGSRSPKTPVSLRFPADTLDVLFPRLFPET